MKLDTFILLQEQTEQICLYIFFNADC